MFKNMKKIKSFIAVCLSFLIIFAMMTPVRAEEKEEVTFNEVQGIGEKVAKYLVVDGSYVYFNYEKAQENQESIEVVRQGLLLESISNEFHNIKDPKLKSVYISIPIWGNYCGPGYNGEDFTKESLDILDEGCRQHDKCFKWGLSLTQNCECNKALVDYIDRNKDKMSGKMAVVAWAIRTYFDTIGMIGC